MTNLNRIEQHKAIVRRFLVATHAGRIETVDQLVVTDIVTHGFPGTDPRSREEYQSFFRMLNAAFPDRCLRLTL